MPLSHIKLPTMGAIIPKQHTLGNELQMKMLQGVWLTNLLLIYLCIFFTIKLVGVGQ